MITAHQRIGNHSQQRLSLALVGTAPPATQVPLMNPTYDSEDFTASIETQIGHVCRFEFASSPESSQWQGLRLFAGTGRTLTLRDPVIAGQQRYYRVRRW